jgi:ATP-binding cassette, subfamily B, bacterial MsbA
MRDAIRIFRRFLPPYKRLIGLNILFNLLGTIFGLFSFATVIPVLKILFNTKDTVYHMQKLDFSSLDQLKSELINNLNALIQQLSNAHSPVMVLLFIGVFFVVMVLFKTGFTYLATLMMVYIRNYVVRDIRNIIYRKVVDLPIGFFTQERKGDIMARTTGDVSEIEYSIMSSLDMFFKNPIIIIITVGFMVFMSWQLTLFVFILFPVAGSLIGIIGKRLKRASMRLQNKMGEILSVIEETLGGLRIIKAFSAEPVMKNMQAKQNESYRLLANRAMGRQHLASPLSEFLGTMIVVIVMVYGGKLILTHDDQMLDSATFIAYIVFFFSIIQPTKAFASAFYNIQKGLAAMERVDRVLNTTNPIVNIQDPLPLDSFEQGIQYRNIWFRYGEEPVLRNINLTVKKGKSIALVGQSGSGKSTLVDLLPRFYDVEEGGIYIDEKNIKEVRIEDLRGLFGIVNQEPILFNDTIYNNIAFGTKVVTEEQVVQAAKIANAHEFILATENGYETNIGDRGTKLSGGQRQRISIARAILKNPPILILDEATSALDTESERLVQEAIDNLMKHRTSIVIAHRLSTIRNVDEIYVLHRGKIIESGSYKELLALNGEFKKLHDNQFQY